MLCCDDVDPEDLLLCRTPPESSDRLVPVFDVAADVVAAEFEDLCCCLLLELDLKKLKQPIG